MKLDAHFDMYPEQAFKPRNGRFGGMTLEGGKGGSAPSADPNIGIAQREMSALASKQWDTFQKDIYPEMLRQSQVQETRANDQWNTTKDIATKQQGYADQDRARYEKGAIPAMEALKRDADQYNEAGYQEQLASQAMGDVNSQFDNQRQQQAMRQQAYGIDPTSGAAMGASNANSVMQAAAGAAAMNQTRQAAHEIGLQKQANVYNMYAGLPAQGNASTQLGMGAMSQGLAGGQAALGNFGTTGGALNAAASTANQGWNSVGQLGVSKYGADVSAYNAQQQASGAFATGLGSAIGSGVALYAGMGAKKP